MNKRRPVSTSELMRRKGRLLVGPNRPRLELEEEIEEIEKWMIQELTKIRKRLDRGD